jgi:hypothetical protein
VAYPSDAERRRLERFPEQIAVEDLRACFALSDADRALVFAQRGAANRLGLAVQLCALRFLGFVPHLAGLPSAALEFLAGQVDAAAYELLEYGGRPRTRVDHLARVREHLGYQTLDSAAAVARALARPARRRARCTGRPARARDRASTRAQDHPSESGSAAAPHRDGTGRGAHAHRGGRRRPARAPAARGARRAVDTDPKDRAHGDALYDSAERRRDLAAELEGLADEETIEARVVADTNQALPAEEAVSNTPRRTPRHPAHAARATRSAAPRHGQTVGASDAPAVVGWNRSARSRAK